MKQIKNLLVIVGLLFTATSNAQTTKYKCMIQMNSYLGEGAYIVISLVDKSGNYEKTLAVLGDDKEWYPDWKEWYKTYKKRPVNISAITRASVSGGDRAVVTLELDQKKLNAGYTLRFESSVEDKPYYLKDAEVPFTAGGIEAKTDGKGYIKYVRFSGN